MVPACPACALSAQAELFRLDDYYGSYVVLVCPDCGTQHIHPDGAPPPPEADGYWQEHKLEIHASDAVEREVEERQGRFLAAVSQAVRGPMRSVLDVGSGVGSFLALATKLGMSAVGVDIEPRAVEVARARGFRAFAPSELEQVVADGSVDLISLWDVLEHTPDPLSMLTSVSPKLRAGGGVVIETPDAAFPGRPVVRLVQKLTQGRFALAGRLYYWEHKVYFTSEGLRRLLARAGIRMVRVLHESSPRTKTSTMLDYMATKAEEGRRSAKLLRAMWPAMESVTRRVGGTNKLVVVGVKD